MNFRSNAQAVLLTTLADAFQKIPDPRTPRGVHRDFQGMLILVFLGLLARIPSVAQIQCGAKKHWVALREPQKYPKNRQTFFGCGH